MIKWWNEWLMHVLEGWMHKCFYAKHKGNLWRKTERNIQIILNCQFNIARIKMGPKRKK